MTPDPRLLLLEGVSLGTWQGAMSALVLAFVLGAIVSMLHRWTVRPRAVSTSLAASLALLPMIATLVLIVIGDSLARSFALVGALAIVRFRTRMRSTWDITFVFMSLAVGIACGVGRVDIAVVGTGIAILAALALGALPGTRREGEVHAVRCDVAAWQCGDAQLQEILVKHAEGRRLVSTRSQRFGEALSLTYHVTLRNEVGVDVLVRDLAEVEGVERVEALGVADAAG